MLQVAVEVLHQKPAVAEDLWDHRLTVSEANLQGANLSGIVLVNVIEFGTVAFDVAHPAGMGLDAELLHLSIARILVPPGKTLQHRDECDYQRHAHHQDAVRIIEKE